MNNPAEAIRNLRNVRKAKTDSLRPPPYFGDEPPSSSRTLLIVAIIAALVLAAVVFALLASVAPSHLLIVLFLCLWFGWGIWRRR